MARAKLKDVDRDFWKDGFRFDVPADICIDSLLRDGIRDWICLKNGLKIIPKMLRGKLAESIINDSIVHDVIKKTCEKGFGKLLLNTILIEYNGWQPDPNQFDRLLTSAGYFKKHPEKKPPVYEDMSNIPEYSDCIEELCQVMAIEDVIKYAQADLLKQYAWCFCRHIRELG